VVLRRIYFPEGELLIPKFKIPIPIKDHCNISGADNSPLGTLLCETALIIFDEASMLHRACYEAVDTTFRDGKRNDDAPFGGIPILFSGDFRQILPVVKHGTRYDIMDASSQRPDLWQHISVMHLTYNMRIAQREKDNAREVAALKITSSSCCKLERALCQ